MSDQQPAPVKRSRRLYILWGVALTLLISTAIFCWLVVVPVWRTDRVIRNFDFHADSEDEFVQQLGGPGEALRLLRLYTRMPNWIATHEPKAVRLLGACGARAIPEIIPFLRSPDDLTRFHAANALRRIGPPAVVAVPALVHALGDADPAVREECARALGSIGPKAVDATRALIPLLSDVRHGVRRAAADALGAIKPDSASAATGLIRLMNDSRCHTAARHAAVRALARVGATDVVVPALVVAVRSKQDDNYVGALAMVSLKNIGKPAVPGLIKLLQEKDTSLRYLAASALESVVPVAKEATPALLRLLSDDDPMVRTAAAGALEKIKAAESAKAPR